MAGKRALVIGGSLGVALATAIFQTRARLELTRLLDASDPTAKQLGEFLDVLTGTTSGPELPEAEIKVWFEQRNAVNRYFTALGYTGVNANKKPWCEGPYGRETQAIKLLEPKRNALTTDATARLMTVYELDGPVTSSAVRNRCLAYLDGVNSEIEVDIRSMWPSHLARLRKEGLA